MTVVNYDVISHHRLWEFVEKVKKHIDSGWQPIGGCSVTTDGSNTTHYVQAFVKYAEGRHSCMIDRTFFTSDQHWMHTNIIKYSQRPFEYSTNGCEQMDEQMIDNWNKVIPADGLVYHVGDIFLGDRKRARYIRSRLNGQIFLIKGNHEKTATAEPDLFAWIKDYYKLKVDDPDADRGIQDVILFHYSLRVWDKSHHSSWAISGHSHNSLMETRYNVATGGLGVDVGVDSAAYYFGENSLPENYKPFSYQDIKKIMKWKAANATSRFPDHHKPETR
jgi:calcineurin-like phosphoesterase family protein